MCRSERKLEFDGSSAREGRSLRQAFGTLGGCEKEPTAKAPKTQNANGKRKSQRNIDFL